MRHETLTPLLGMPELDQYDRETITAAVHQAMADKESQINQVAPDSNHSYAQHLARDWPSPYDRVLILVGSFIRAAYAKKGLPGAMREGRKYLGINAGRALAAAVALRVERRQEPKP